MIDDEDDDEANNDEDLVVEDSDEDKSINVELRRHRMISKAAIKSAPTPGGRKKPHLYLGSNLHLTTIVENSDEDDNCMDLDDNTNDYSKYHNIH